MYRVVIRSLSKPEECVTIAEFKNNESMARYVLKNFTKAKWDMSRRPGIGVIDHIVVRIEKE